MRRRATSYLASFTKGVSVNTLEPGIAGIALLCHGSASNKHRFEYTYHDATGLGERSTSTKHILHIEYIRNLKLLDLEERENILPTVARNSQSLYRQGAFSQMVQATMK